MKKQKKLVLIVDDQQANRVILKKILSAEYNTVEAANGKEALTILRRGNMSFAAIMLDIIMPVMNGYEFLREVNDSAFLNLPIIVMTGEATENSEQRALEMGAWDYVTKPYQSKVLLSRLKNAIARSQVYLLEKMRYMAEHDMLTGLHNRTKFFEETRNMINLHSGEQFVLVRFDIDNFRLYNSFWGEREGDRLLCFLADCIRKTEEFCSYCTYGRIDADIFCMCEPYNEDSLSTQIESVKSAIRQFKQDYFIEPSFGIYVIDDTAVPVETMYIRASMGAKKCKGSYTAFSGYYDQKLEDGVLREQQIVNQMYSALLQEQFVIYFQPKYNLKTNLPYGAEALVRWNHPKEGLISPGVFIPVFERNGFIGKLDIYIWDKVCQLLRKWIDDGFDPAPVSVNVSRVDLYNPKITEILSDMIAKYKLSPALLNLELTESAYMDNPDMMRETIHKLHRAGFTIMMDDFGSGYSSLNTLKDIPVDILKIDMNFLSGSCHNSRSDRILASVIRMAGWLDLPVIVEGVETKEQKDFLQSIGCGYIQGYFFARPMPVADYEGIIKNVKQEPIAFSTKDHRIMIESILSSNPQENFIFNSFPQPAAIYEFDNEYFSLLRANDTFHESFGYGESVGNVRVTCIYCIPQESMNDVLAAFRYAVQSHDTAECDYYALKDNVKCKYRIKLKYLGRKETTDILFAVFYELYSSRDIDLESLMTLKAGDKSPETNSAKKSYALNELAELLGYLKTVFDIVRIVDPNDTSVITFDSFGGMHREPYSCFRVWNKQLRCENCTSSKACLSGCQHTKYEFIQNNVFYVISRPIIIFAGGESYRVVLEIVSHVSDQLLLEKNNGKTLAESIKETNDKMYRDELTKAYNRRYLNEFSFIHHFSNRVIRRIAFIMLDIRHFKAINDTYGHLTGDMVLQNVVSKLNEHIRKQDSVVRMGGDEFLIILTDCEESAAQSKIEELRKALNSISYHSPDKQTVSGNFGYSYTDSFEAEQKFLKQMLEKADKRMYMEKKGDRHELFNAATDSQGL